MNNLNDIFFAPAANQGIDWASLSVIWQEVPVGILAFLLVGLCTSVMWGGIFNMAVEGLGTVSYTHLI